MQSAVSLNRGFGGADDQRDLIAAAVPSLQWTIARNRIADSTN